MNLLFFLPKEGSPHRRTVMLTLSFSVAVHVAAALGAGAWIVARYFAPPPAVFVAKKSVSIPPKIQEQKMALAEFDAMSPKPSFDDKISSARATDFALPDLPKMPVDQMMPIDPGSAITDQIGSLVGGNGTGSGSGGDGEGGFGGTGTGFSFFGIEATGKSVIIVIDISGTMFDRLGAASFAVVQKNASDLIDSLSINTRFGLIFFSGGAGKWQKDMVPASAANKEAGKKFVSEINDQTYRKLDRLMKDVLREETGSTRPDLALKLAFSCQPEVIFFISDGEATKNGGKDDITADEIVDLTKTLQAGLSMPAKINAIHYVTGKNKPNERELIEKLARRNDGKFRQVEAKDAMK